MERRQRGGAHGTRLFMASGFDVIRHELRSWPFVAHFDDEEVRGRSLVFAVQVGPTYGGGFPICPSADPRDGLLDVCHSVEDPSRATALLTFVKARFGAHTHSRYLRFRAARKLVVDFEGEPPCQADGERVVGSHFEVECVHRALEVIWPTWRL